MSGYRFTEKSEVYKEALESVESIEPPAIGFSKPEITTGTNLNKIVKQNNTIIQLLVKVAEDTQRTKEELGEVKRALTKLLDQGKSAEVLEDVVTRLENWKPGETSKPLVEKKQNPFYVFEDPYKILKREKEKAAKASK